MVDKDLLKKQILFTSIAFIIGLSVAWVFVSFTGSTSAPLRNIQETKLQASTIDPKEIWIQKAEAEAETTNKRIENLEKGMETLQNTLQHSISGLQTAIEEKQQQPVQQQEQFSNQISVQQSQQDAATEKQNVIGKVIANLKEKPVESVIPAGTFAKAILLGGVDASTSIAESSNPRPVIMRVIDKSYLPKKFQSDIIDCRLIGSSYGDLASERVYIRLEKLSCINIETGEGVEEKVFGYVAGEDGRPGLRGTLVDKSNEYMRTALLGGFFGGLGQFFGSQTQKPMQIGTGGWAQMNPLTNKEMLQAGVGSGVGTALNKYADYYIKRAEQLQPVLQVASGRKVDIVFTDGTKFIKKEQEKVQEKTEKPSEEKNEKIDISKLN